MMAPYLGLFNIWVAQTTISATYRADWTFSALVVDINEDLSPKDEKEISVSSVLSELY